MFLLKKGGGGGTIGCTAALVEDVNGKISSPSKGKAREVNKDEIRESVPVQHQRILPVMQAQTST
jgi:hypothetical protein